MSTLLGPVIPTRRRRCSPDLQHAIWRTEQSLHALSREVAQISRSLVELEDAVQRDRAWRRAPRAVKKAVGVVLQQIQRRRALSWVCLVAAQL